MATDAGAQANDRMVDRLIAASSLWSRPVIDAFRATPRHGFLDRVFHFSRSRGRWCEIDVRQHGHAALRLVYADRALTTRLSEPRPGQPATPISSSSQPSLMSVILEDLQLSPGLRVLEIGAGTGYNAALMAHVGPVVSLDVDRRVLAEAGQHLSGFPDRAVTLVHGDGRDGYPDRAPYDRILVTASTPDLEPAWLEQAGDGGWVMAPLALAPGLAFMILGTCRDGIFTGRLRRPAYFMQLRTESGPDADDPTARIGGLPEPKNLTATTPPWDERDRPRPKLNDGGGIPQALAFLGWLQGLTVSYQLDATGKAAYGVADMVRGHVCWLGRRERRVTGASGLEIGRRLCGTLLDAGGLWPGDFTLHAAQSGRDLRANAGPLTFARRGPICAQLWEWTGPVRGESAP